MSVNVLKTDWWKLFQQMMTDLPGFDILPIHKAASMGDRGLAALQIELSRGVDIDAADDDGWTPLIIAARNARHETVKFLLERKATVDKTDGIGGTALHHACYFGNAGIAGLLLDNGAAIEARNRHGSGNSALSIAVCANKPSCVKLLLERKADATVATAAGRTLLGSTQSLEIVELLRAPAADKADSKASVCSITDLPIHKAASKGDITAIQIELSRGVDIDAAVMGSWTPLIIAARNAQHETAQFLLDRKATVDKMDSNGSTALHHACYSGNAGIAGLLLDNGAAIEARQGHGFGDTALILAVSANSPSCVKLLLERKADTTVATEVGRTAIGVAKSAEIFELLRSAPRVLQDKSDSLTPASVFRNQRRHPADSGSSFAICLRTARAWAAAQSLGLLTSPCRDMFDSLGCPCSTTPSAETPTYPSIRTNTIRSKPTCRCAKPTSSWALASAIACSTENLRGGQARSGHRSWTPNSLPCASTSATTKRLNC